MTKPVTWGDLQKLASETTFIDAPAGTHLMTITKATLRKTNDGSKDMIMVIFKITTPGPNQNATQPHNFTISPDSPGAMGFFFRYMAGLGFDAAFFSSYTHMPISQLPPIITPMLMGRSAMVTIGPDRNNASRLVVTDIKRAVAGPPSAPLSPAQQTAGLSVFAPVPPAAQAAALTVPPPPPVAAPAPQSAPDAGEDAPELPF